MRALGLVWDDDLDIWRKPGEAPGIGGRVYSVHTMQAGERRLERRSPGVRQKIRELIDAHVIEALTGPMGRDVFDENEPGLAGRIATRIRTLREETAEL